MDWTAIDQLFPFLPRNNVRQRLVTLRQEAGGQSYLRLLEDKWHELWLEHRGTEALPDENPSHPFNFDIIAHVEFLRSHTDKRAL
jgi:oxalate---CoA ligase